MRRNQNNGLWLLGAMAAPLAHYAGCGYPAVIFAVVAFLPLMLLSRGSLEGTGRVLSFAEWIWAMVVLSQLLPGASEYWLAGGVTVPLVLLALAAIGAGNTRQARAGNVLFWLVVPVIGLVVLLASKNVEPEWLTPNVGDWSSGLIVTMLLPGLVCASASEWNGAKRVLPWIGIAAVGFSVLVQGCLSGQVGAEEAAPLYAVGRTIGGGAEILVSVGMTLSWYGLCSLLFDAAMQFAERWGISGKWARSISFLIPAGMIVFDVSVQGMILVGGCILLWIIVPALCPKNKMKKDEKRC